MRFIITFYSQFGRENHKMFDKFKKEEGGEMVEEKMENEETPMNCRNNFKNHPNQK